MKYIFLALITLCLATSLQAVKSGSYSVRRNTAGTIGESFGQSFADSMNESIRRQQELDHYKKMLELEYQEKMKYERELKRYEYNGDY